MRTFLPRARATHRQGGGVVRGAGFDEQGTWDALPLGGTTPENPGYQLNLHIFGSGTVISSPAIASSPPALRINNNGAFVGNYVLDLDVPAGGARCR